MFKKYVFESIVINLINLEDQNYNILMTSNNSVLLPVVHSASKYLNLFFRINTQPFIDSSITQGLYLFMKLFWAAADHKSLL